LVEALTGLRSALSGTLRIAGQEVAKASPRVITEVGTAHIPEDRQRDGLVLSYSIADNLVLNTYYLPPVAKGGVMLGEGVDERAEHWGRI
jgi:simple sugar transport system ATP-binding protein